jgi:hypothetical protein
VYSASPIARVVPKPSSTSGQGARPAESVRASQSVAATATSAPRAFAIGWLSAPAAPLPRRLSSMITNRNRTMIAPA